MKWHKQVCFTLALKGFLPVDKYIKLKKILVKGDKFIPESDIGNKAVILEQCDTIDVESNTVLFQSDAMVTCHKRSMAWPISDLSRITCPPWPIDPVLKKIDVLLTFMVRKFQICVQFSSI